MEVCHTIFNNRLKSKKIAGHFLLLECGLLFEKNGGYLRTLKRKIMEEDSILLFNWKKNNGTNIYQNILIAIMPCKFDVVWQIKAPIIWLQSYQNFFQIAECESPLGLQSGDIPDSDITASSEVRNLTKLEAFNFSERVFFLQLRDTEEDIYWSNHRRLVTRNFITWLLHIISKQGLCFHSSFFNSKCFQIFTAKCLKHFFLFYEKT